MVLHDPAGIAYVAAAVVFACVAALTWRRRANNPTIAGFLSLVMLWACWWSVADAVAWAATNPTVAAIASLAIFPGVSCTVLNFVLLGLCVFRPQWVPSRRLVAALLVEPVLISVAAATNPWHLLVYRGAGAAQLTGSAGWELGPVFWLHTGYSYVALAFAIGLLARAWWTAPPAFRGQRLALLLASLAPIAVNAVHIAGGLPLVSDPTPLGFALTGTMMAYAIFRHDLFTFAPVARALIVDQIGDAIVAISPDERVLDLNPAAIELVRGLDPGATADPIGRSVRDLFAHVSVDARGADGYGAEVTVTLPRGRAEFHVRAFPLLDRRDRALGTVLVARDVTEANAQTRRLSAANEQLVRQVETIERLRADLVEVASRDALTGLHNRRHLVDRFGPLLAAARRTGDPLTVALIDVDRFKAINDRYGHLIGDEVLIALSHRIRAGAPAASLVARWGGEEFFVALPGADAATGVAFAEDLRARCERDPIEVPGPSISCTLSIGVATCPASGTTMNELFHAADVAMYEAKSDGRNIVRLHAPPVPIAAVTGAPGVDAVR